MFLRKTFNVYNSQIILRHATLLEFMDMSHEMRLQMFHQVIREENLVRFHRNTGLRVPIIGLDRL
jgi:hypothetical protein